MRVAPSVRLLLLVALATVLSLGSACDDDPAGIVEDAEFLADPLTGGAERPDPVTTDATGTAFFDVDGSTVRFRIEVEDIEDVILAHIHNGGVDIAGPIVVELFNAAGTPRTFTARGVLVESTFTEADFEAAGGITTLDALIDAMDAGTVYVNVHTTQNPAGEIRGQIEER
jgi:hypothetical protein